MANQKITLTQEKLKELLHYSPNTGAFNWINPVARTLKPGDMAGGINVVGYRTISVLGIRYLAHRLAFLYMTGEWPQHEVDHIDCDRGNNMFNNLRCATRATNSQNQKTAQKNNKSSGILGVYQTPNKKRWKAVIHAGKPIHIGVFDTPELAHAAYLEAKRRLHPGCTI